MKEWLFHLRVVLANFVSGPIVAYLLIQLFSLETNMAAALLIFSMCAGAPFMIKLVNFSDNDVALGASLMLVLVLVSVIYVPIFLPLLGDIEVGAWEVFTNLFRQLVIPIILGALLDYFFTSFSSTIQPWVARIGNIALWVVIIGTMVGNVEGIISLAGNGAMTAGVLFILIVTILGISLQVKTMKIKNKKSGLWELDNVTPQPLCLSPQTTSLKVRKYSCSLQSSIC